MNILFLGSEDLELYYWLKNNHKDVLFMNRKIDIKYISKINPSIVISHGYKHIITDDIIKHLSGNIINLHVSYLPWNRGSSPNLWSFVDETKKGVTIHFIDKGIDTGDIILQKELSFDEDIETLKTSYYKLQKELKDLFKNNWDDIINKNYKSISQDLSEGSIHYDRETNKILKSFDNDVWDIPITKFKKKI